MCLIPRSDQKDLPPPRLHHASTAKGPTGTISAHNGPPCLDSVPIILDYRHRRGIFVTQETPLPSNQKYNPHAIKGFFRTSIDYLGYKISSDGNSYPVQYYSRTLRKYERNYTITELECLAIIETLDRFKVPSVIICITILEVSPHEFLLNDKLFFRSSLLFIIHPFIPHLKGVLMDQRENLNNSPFGMNTKLDIVGNFSCVTFYLFILSISHVQFHLLYAEFRYNRLCYKRSTLNILREPRAATVFWIVFDFYLLKKKMDQRTCIKFCVKNEIKCADAFRMLTVAYGEATLDQSNFYRWYKMFSEGREDVNDEERAGRPSTSTTDEKINEVEKMILANRRITVREVAEDLNISIGSCHSIFINDLVMRRVAAKFVPKLLNCDQKQHRMNIANEMLVSVRDDPNLLQRVITGDEAWVYGYDVETNAQSSQWKLPHEPRPKKARQVRSNVKVLLTVFFDCRGVVHHKFLPQGRTVNKEYYLQVMRNLREAIRQKRPDLWKNKNWLLHHDNAPAHTSLLVRDFLAKNNRLMMPQPPYSPDLAPCDFFLFPKLKRPMKGRHYATLDEIKTASKEELKKI
ncbi:hypothetical protein LAZ67_15001657 [Cordylochernes scorpioides]|uniref:Transposase n=1 Tax=Cordylochernes scorpioides TaxID=51811 RepID=A0ABY6L8X5_9ARAC|nr:hypothetical protein LAZ67_15001657 [Cordylochernes scorpioides]